MSRSRCDACLRLEKNCLCEGLSQVDNCVEVLFLQHPLETYEVKNTARLAYLSLQNAHWWVGEVFDPQVLSQRLANKCWVLLYPETPEGQARGVTPDSLRAEKLENVGLVVLDGTWRKTRKMLFLNPILANLPRLQMRFSGVSGYDIRKQKNAHSYSTLEAVQQALSCLEGSVEKYDSLTEVFEALKQQQKSFIFK